MRRHQRAFSPIFSNPQPLTGNVVTNGSALDNASWDTLTVEMTRTGNVVRAPDGSMTADILIPTATNSSNHNVGLANLTSTGGDWIMRGRFKAAGYGVMEMIIGSTTGFAKFLAYAFDLQRGQICTIRNTTYTGPATMRRLADGWYFCEMRVIGADANSTHRVDLHVCRTPATTATYSGDTFAGIHAWGIEFSAVPA